MLRDVPAEELTYEEIAARLRRALAKLALRLGDPGPWKRLPSWIKKAGKHLGERRNACGKCGTLGHNSRTCPIGAASSKPRVAPAT